MENTAMVGGVKALKVLKLQSICIRQWTGHQNFSSELKSVCDLCYIAMIQLIEPWWYALKETDNDIVSYLKNAVKNILGRKPLESRSFFF